MQQYLDRFRTPTPRFVLRWAWASVLANAMLVLTGGAVRLTKSGLGCPTWPRCTTDSFVPHAALGVNGIIEFGNRLLTYVLVVIAVGTWIAVWRWTSKGDRRRVLVTVMALSIPAQAVIGGITVLTDLNPWVVALHVLCSFALIAASMLLVVRVKGVAPALVPPTAAWVVGFAYLALWVVLYLGTVVTGSGPHAGDIHAPRNGLSPRAMSQLHADLVFLLVGLSIGCILVLAAVGAPRYTVRLAGWLVGVELAQGAVGFVQYATGLPIVLVWFHLLGASVLVAVGTRLLLAVGTSARRSTTAGAATSAAPAQWEISA